MNQRDILAIEGEWQDNLRHTESVVSALQFLQQIDRIKNFVHRRAPTREAFLQYLDWGVAEGYRFLYLAGHGSKGELGLGANSVTLRQVSDRLAGRLSSNTAVHWGTCEFMQVGAEQVEQFKEKTGAGLVSGYTREVDFLESMLLDMAWMAFLQETRDRRRIQKEFLEGPLAGLIGKLGFTMV
jgi:hypothetical protein